MPVLASEQACPTASTSAVPLRPHSTHPCLTLAQALSESLPGPIASSGRTGAQHELSPLALAPIHLESG